MIAPARSLPHAQRVVLCLSLIVGGTALLGCARQGEKYVGYWQNVDRPAEVLEIERNGENFVVTEERGTLGAVYRDGLLEVTSGAGLARITWVEKTDTLIVPMPPFFATATYKRMDRAEAIMGKATKALLARDWDKCIGLTTEALEAKPQGELLGQAYSYRGGCRSAKYDCKQALDDYEECAKLGGSTEASCRIRAAWLYAIAADKACRDSNRALTHAQKAMTLGCPEAHCFDTLAAAEASVGKFEDAVTAEREAIRLLRPEDSIQSERYHTRLALYLDHKPYIGKGLPGTQGEKGK